MLNLIVGFTVDGVPVGKGRPKFARRGNFVTAYTPAKTKTYEEQVALVSRIAMKTENKTICSSAIRVNMEIFVPIPKSWSKIKRTRALNGEEYPTTKPDADNVAKGVLDALNGIVFEDDKQVVGLFIVKRYSDRPRVEVRVYEFCTLLPALNLR